MTKKLVVSDSSTLILLAKAGIIEIVAKEFSVFIPKIVFVESVERGKEKGRQDAFAIEKMVKDGLFKIKQPSRKNLDKIKELFNLQMGEQHALALALEIKAEFLLTDDLKAINACKTLNIKFVTALSLLIQFYEKKLLTKEKARQSFNALEDFGWYSTAILRPFKSKLFEVKT